MKLPSLTLLATTSIFAVTAQAQSLQIGGGATPTGAISAGQPGVLNTGTTLTLLSGGNLSISSGGSLNVSSGSAISATGGTLSLQSPTRVSLPSPTSGTIFLRSPGGIVASPSSAQAPRPTISLTSAPPAIASTGTINLTSTSPAQTAPQATPQGVVPVAMPIASAGGLVNGAVTVRMPLVNASAITVR